jgi:signal peptidase I
MANSADAKLGAGYANNFIKDFGLWFTWSWLLRQCWAVLVLAVLGMLSYSLISHFLFQSVQVDGQSMYPSLKNSGHYWLNRFAYVVSDPKPQEIVALKSPGDNTLVVKRIIGLPGQSIYLHQGKVYLDGKLLNEPYLLTGTPTYAYEKSEDEFICIGNGEYFVMGDNRNNSTDSRTFGTVPRDRILGRVKD